MYQTLRISQSEFIPIRTYNYHVRMWGKPSADRPPLFMVHGWMDVGASFQFMVDAFLQDRWIICPDWRGYGLTHLRGDKPGQCISEHVDNYWIADYIADLDFLIDHYCPQSPVDLLGHSLGGNVVMHYAGSRPRRIRRLINLEGFGMPRTQPSQAPGRYAQWMDALKAHERGENAMKAYSDLAGVANRLMKTNPRLNPDKAQWLAQHWAAKNSKGQWEILGDPAHKIINAQLFRVEESLACYQSIEAPVLAVEATDDSLGQWWKGRYTLGEYHERLQSVKNLQIAKIENAGHMMHHDQPEKLAQLIDDFLL